MTKFLILFTSLMFICFPSTGNQVIVIDLHNKSIDQLLNEQESDKSIDQEITSNEDALVDNVEDLTDINVEQEIIDQESNEIIALEEIDVAINELSEIINIGEKINKEDLIFLLNNIKKINSPVLKKELISILNLSNIEFDDFNKEDLDKLIIETLLDLGDRKKSYQLIQSLETVENLNHNNFYKEVKINYLLSSYNLSETCDYRKDIKSENFINNDFFLKIDIFCLLLLEKYDEANLLNSLLNENIETEDDYFYYLFNKLQNIDLLLKNISEIEPDEKNIFLYSAMHRIGNIPMTEKFIEVDPINLSMPIILSSSTDIELRLKAAHLAYSNNLINTDSLAALYQTVDFTYEQLNDSANMMSILNNNIEIGMAYFFQLINIQILPMSRLEAIIKFWNFAQKNNLEFIAYNLSQKNLNTIEPSNELSTYGPKISKSYVYCNDFINAEKWLLFSNNSINDYNSVAELNSSKLLFSLFNIDKSENLIDVLVKNLQYMNESLLDKNSSNYAFKNEILNLIFNSLNENFDNPFVIEKKILENRLMPSLYLIDIIRSSSQEINNPKLLLAIIASINDLEWKEVHPEHFRLIIMGLKKYENGKILNDFLLEVLKQTNII